MMNCINQQMMEQMLTKMEEVFAQMIVNIDAAIVRVFDRVMSDEKTMELDELKSIEKLHEAIEKDISENLRKSSNEATELNSSKSKGVLKINTIETKVVVVEDPLQVKEPVKLEEVGGLQIWLGDEISDLME